MPAPRTGGGHFFSAHRPLKGHSTQEALLAKPNYKFQKRQKDMAKKKKKEEKLQRKLEKKQSAGEELEERAVEDEEENGLDQTPE